jgi:anti-sigma factor RsiW
MPRPGPDHRFNRLTRRPRALAVPAVLGSIPRWALALLGAAGLLVVAAASGVTLPWSTQTVWLQGWLVELLLPQMR